MATEALHIYQVFTAQLIDHCVFILSAAPALCPLCLCPWFWIIGSFLGLPFDGAVVMSVCCFSAVKSKLRIKTTKGSPWAFIVKGPAEASFRTSASFREASVPGFYCEGPGRKEGLLLGLF